jgi:hypothetical protein
MLYYWFNGIQYFKADGSIEEKWDTVIPADLKRLFLSGTYMSRWPRKGSQGFSGFTQG